ncbi:Hypothetical predicted protein [Cloeon dipterum]|uniref:NTF2 domain-containing protein n=1 Tax=Cloeon dipterum TaxID=197152 RepID=A0A8S1CL46_9INSE|nr:Hypothetical predicted protein [Cloeon dipterum]
MQRTHKAKMLTELETEQLTGLLSLMGDDDLKSLTKTVTNTLIIPNDAKDAVSTILKYSPSVASVLGRKKITKELVFRYLHKMRVKGAEPSMNKSRMIELINKHFESDKKSRLGKTAEDRQETNLVPAITKIPKVKEETRPDEAQTSTSSGNEESRVVLTDQPASKIKESEEIDEYTDAEEMITEQSQVQISQKIPSDGTLQLFSETFIKWFYDLFNKGVADSGQKFGPEHFWPDSQLIIKVEGPNLNVVEERSSGNESSALLAQMRSHFDVLLNPNISADGVVAQTETHGLIKIVVCGTAHRKDLCVGFFEQSFLLIRDPTMQNNWRIKKTEMQMKTTIDGKSGQADLNAASFLPMILQ